ncbi:MAG: hypothetical protein CMJ45_08310 [Planctomyces sp.]|nr:hypothetical protein [Planctomyces sp.]
MGDIKIEGVTHWSIPVNDLTESEEFYGGLLGLTGLGRLGNSMMSCFNVGDHNILLCERAEPVNDMAEKEQKVHHSFTVSPETLDKAFGEFKEKNVEIAYLVYRRQGFFTGRELYFFDPSGNRLELRDPTWETGMPEPTLEEIYGS